MPNVAGTAWGLNPRVTVSRGDMGVSDWGNKGSVIKGDVDTWVAGIKKCRKIRGNKRMVCTNNHEILSLMLYYPFALDGEEGKEDLSGTDDLHDRGGALGDLKSSRDKVFKDYSMG